MKVKYVINYKRKKKNFEQLREKRLRGSLVRSRAIWRENSEKPSKYFLTLERRYLSKRISSIKAHDGIKRCQTDILKAFEEYFRKRFSQHDINKAQDTCSDYLVASGLRVISTSDRVKLCEPITVAELGSTLLKMKNGTSPGSDGFSVEFYKFFWTDLKEFVYATCMESVT